MSALEKRHCKFCGAPIAFARTEDGAGKMPLTLVRSFYVVHEGQVRAVGASADAEGLERAVSHWETCSRVEAAKKAQERRRQQRTAGARRA